MLKAAFEAGADPEGWRGDRDPLRGAQAAAPACPRCSPPRRPSWAPASVSTVALITDGRFSGGSHGFIVGHVTPEAQEGGPDRPGQRTATASPSTPSENSASTCWCHRRPSWNEAPRRVSLSPPLQGLARGTLYKYIKTVKPASEGCVTDE